MWAERGKIELWRFGLCTPALDLAATTRFETKNLDFGNYYNLTVFHWRRFDFNEIKVMRYHETTLGWIWDEICHKICSIWILNPWTSAKVMLETRVRLSHRAGGLAFCRENSRHGRMLLDIGTLFFFGMLVREIFMGFQGFPNHFSEMEIYHNAWICRWSIMVFAGTFFERLFERFSWQSWYTFFPSSLSTVWLAMSCHVVMPAICSKWVWSDHIRSYRKKL